MRLRFTMTDLDGVPVGSFVDTTTGEVVIPLSDSRTGSLTVSMYDPAVKELTVGDKAVKVTYGPELVLNGIVTKLSDNFETGLTTITVQDPTVRTKYRNLRYGHASVTASEDSEPGVPLDGTGFRMILTDCGGGGAIPHTHIAEGTDDVPAATLYVRVSRGQQGWEALTSMTEAASGFDVDFAPVDALHPGAQPWEPGIMCEVRTTPLQGKDRSQGNTEGNDPVVLAYGKELTGLLYEPDAEKMVNYDVQVAPGGQSDPADNLSKAGAYNHSSWVQYGIWEKWESAGEELVASIRQEVLQNRALAVVRAYGVPPQFFTATPTTDEPDGHKYPNNLAVGDIVTVVGKRGYRKVIANGRIVQVTLSQRDQNGNASLQLLCVPHQTSDADILFDGSDEDG